MIDIKKVMEEVVNREGSDLHLKSGRPPLIRKDGQLKPFSNRSPIARDEIRDVLAPVVRTEKLDRLDEEYELDTAYHMEGVARFRINVFKQMGKVGAVMRAIPLEVPSIEEMNLPEKLRDFVLRPQGMVLVTGPTGSGKSTSLASMIQHLNTREFKHVITIEDPIEYVYTDRKCTITQREVGQDTPSFKEALRRALRQDPDVILVGEMRDRETMEIAIHAAETGHLVFSTLHTNDAKQTMGRILDTFPAEGQKQIQNMLSQSLEGVISQRLLNRKDENGRIPALEIMDASPTIRDLIYDGKVEALKAAIQESQDYYGMQTLNQDLARLVEEEEVTREVAMKTSQNPGDLDLLIKGIDKGSRYSEEDYSEDQKGSSSSDLDEDLNRGFDFD